MFNFFKSASWRRKKEPENLKAVLEHLKRLEKNYQDFSGELKDFKEKSKKTFQKVGIVRFNPFKEIGGDQSFSIALLDANNDGFVITSHYGRETNRVYAKPIERGTSTYQLSEEERKAISRATGS